MVAPLVSLEAVPGLLVSGVACRARSFDHGGGRSAAAARVLGPAFRAAVGSEHQTLASDLDLSLRTVRFRPALSISSQVESLRTLEARVRAARRSLGPAFGAAVRLSFEAFAAHQYLI